MSRPRLDVQFPYTLPRLDLFVRFLVQGIGPTEIAIRVWRLNDDGTNREMVSELRTTVPFATDEQVREHSFRLVNVLLTGEGPYTVRVCRPVRHWTGIRWRVIGADYFHALR